MKINEVEAAVGVTKKNIRFYEEEGLISPSREPGNGYRSYSQADVERLRRMAQIAIICNGGKVIILTGVHSSFLLLQNGKKSDFSQKSAKCWGIWKSFSIISIKDHKRNCKLL